MNTPNLRTFEALLEEQDHSFLKKKISAILRRNPRALRPDLLQIRDAITIERARYYLRRLIKGLTEVKTGRTNDLNLNRWKQYNDIITDSLWIVEKRDRSGNHSGGYWGNFVPQIPHQLLRRFTKPGEWVLDPFLGSGTTLIECGRLNRNGIGIELQPSVAARTRRAIAPRSAGPSSRRIVVTGDSTAVDYKKELAAAGIPSVQFVLVHPPYWDIIRFSSKRSDLSNAPSLPVFLERFGSVIRRCSGVLDRGRHLAVVIGDKYRAGEWIPLGFYAMEEVLKSGFTLKSIVVKNFNQTRGKRNQEELWRYRALHGGFYVFKHEYLFLFQKR